MKKKVKLDLNEGEKICDSCNGVGYHIISFTGSAKWCKKCKGTGKLNWIEEIFGKQEVIISERYDNGS